MHINIVSTMALVPVSRSRCPGALHCPLIAVTLTRILQLRTTQSADTHRPSLKLSYISYMISLPSSPEVGGNGHNAVELQRQTMELKRGLHDH